MQTVAIKLKRLLYLTHRYLGISLCIVMAIWFVSGVVMMYVGYPKLTPAERLEHLPALDLSRCCTDPKQAIHDAGVSKEITALKIIMLGDIPVYMIMSEKDEWTALRADTGGILTHVDHEFALMTAKAFSPVNRPSYIGIVNQDLWTVSRGLDSLRPLHRIALNDGFGTEVYVSGRTGEVVRESSRSERSWNYIGAVAHYIYPIRISALDPYWHDIIVWLSATGTILTVTGAVIGVMRLRFTHHYPNGKHTPYRDNFMRRHHLLGLFFGVITAAWVFSGLMSMNPWKIFGSPSLSKAQRIAFAGGALDPARFVLSPREALEIIKPSFTAKEIVWHIFDGKPFYIFYDSAGQTLLLEAKKSSAPISRFEPTDMVAAVHRLMPGVPITDVQLLDRYDTYYYSRAPHTMTGSMEKRLPILRVKFGDASDTWLHIDPFTGQVHGKLDTSQRIRRWLFAGLHSWDISILLDNRPLWDAFMIGFSLGGFVLSLTGAVIGWRRLSRNL